MRHLEVVVLAVVALVYMGTPAGATPSSEVWIPSTDAQAYGVFHLGIDIYTTMFTDAADGGGDFPTDFGLTVGVSPAETVNLEVGVDLMEPTDDPFSFNAKLGFPEGALGEWSPALAVGGYAFGTESGVTDYDVLYALVSKEFSGLGRLAVGYYDGNDELLMDANGSADETGFLASWDRAVPEVSDKLWVAVDYQSGIGRFWYDYSSQLHL